MASEGEREPYPQLVVAVVVGALVAGERGIDLAVALEHPRQRERGRGMIGSASTSRQEHRTSDPVGDPDE